MRGSEVASRTESKKAGQLKRKYTTTPPMKTGTEPTYHAEAHGMGCRTPRERSTIPKTAACLRLESRLLMFHSPPRFSGWRAVALVALLMAAGSARAQNSATINPGQTSAPGSVQQPATGSQSAAGPANPENDWLAKTSKLYFSSAKAGLAGFNCEVHPDWHALFVSANKGAEAPESDVYLEQLKKVKVRMHARMQGGSTIEWVADASVGNAPSGDPNGVMDKMHQTVQQILEGFLQFWSPFMEVTVVPPKADGLEITHGATSHTIHAKQGATELTEIFNSNLVLEHFNVTLSGTSIKMVPTFEPTPQGLLVKGFSTEIIPAGATPERTQKMQVRVEYQTVNNQTIPGQLNMEIVGIGNFNFAFDGCSTETN
jgi:hypothetical protein